VPEATGTASATQTAIRVHQPGDATFCRAKLYDTARPGVPLQKISEKALTFTGEIEYEHGWLQNRQGTFAPVGFFVRLESSDQKPK
jgi:hypothetical protein